MKRRILSVLLLLLTLTCIPKLCFADECFFSLSEGTPLFSGDPWFDFKLSQVETALKNAGYNEDPMNMVYRSFGVLTYENSYASPHSITLLCENNMVTSVSLTHKGDYYVIKDIEAAISEAAGTPTHTKEYTENFGNYSETHGESLIWAYNGYSYKINGEGSRDKLSKISQIRNGSHPFILTVQRDEGSSKVRDKIEDVKPAAGIYSAANGSSSKSSSSFGNSSKTKTVECEVKVSSVRIKKDSIGNPKIYIVFKNEATNSVDRLDFAVKCYDAYGEEIKPYGHYAYTECFYEQTIIRPKQTSKEDWSWVIYGVEGTRSVEIAITKYHTKSGETVLIPESEYDWKKF